MRTASLVFGLLLVTLLSFQAKAVVQTPGTFIPKECGAQNAVDVMSLVDIDQVCLGKVVGSSGESLPAVEFKMTTNQRHTFRIVGSQAVNGVPALPGHKRFVVRLEDDNGETMEMNIVRTDDGRTRFASGKLDILVYKVQDFEEVFTPMDVIDRVGGDSVPEYTNLPDSNFRLE